jgi:hypothetical protein
MKARIITSVAAAGVLALVVSCTQDQTQSISSPTDASYGKSTAPTCSFSTASNTAKAYFSSNKDPVFALLSLQSTAYKGGASAATSAGLDVLQRLGVARDSGLIKATATDSIGSKFANEVLLCTDLATGIDFRDALGTKGLFAVRSVGDQAAVLSRFKLGDGTPLYGAEPTTDAGYQFSPASKALFYAAPIVTSITDPTVGTVFDLNTLPSPLTFSPALRVGVCDMSIENGRIEHVHGQAVILPPNNPLFCAPSILRLETSGSLFASAAHDVFNWLAPRPAFAAVRSFGTTFKPGGGLVTGLSEIGPVQVLEALTIDSIPNAAVSDTALAIDTLPTGELNLNTSQFNPAVTVHVRTTAGTRIAGVLVQLTVIGNKGSFLAAGDTATTDANGNASFPNLSINKPGGYTVSAKVAELGGDVVFVSNQFQISGQ